MGLRRSFVEGRIRQSSTFPSIFEGTITEKPRIVALDTPKGKVEQAVNFGLCADIPHQFV